MLDLLRGLLLRGQLGLVLVARTGAFQVTVAGMGWEGGNVPCHEAVMMIEPLNLALQKKKSVACGFKNIFPAPCLGISVDFTNQHISPS